MTNRERIIKTLLCEETDRAPFGVGLGFWPWDATLDRWREESGMSDMSVEEMWDHLGCDTGFQIIPAEYGAWPHFDERVISEDDEFITSVDFRGLTMRNRRDYCSMPEFVDNPVKCREDWDKYKAERLEPDFGGRLAGLDEFVEYMQSVDAPVQFGAYPWGILGTARDLMGAEEFLVGLYMQPDVIRDMTATFTDLWIRMCDAASEKVRIDHLHIWEDMCSRNGSLISMEMVEDFMMPLYDRIVALARRKHIPLVSVDSDGLVDEIVPVMMEHGVNVFFPFEVQAGNDILEYRKKYAKLGILYGLDKRVVAENAEQEAIHRELDRAEEMLSYGGYVPGFDHGIPPNVPWKKFVYFVEHLRKIVGA